jgi:hypothetical protein
VARGSDETPARRGPLPSRASPPVDDGPGLTHDELVVALRRLEGIVDVSGDPPNLDLRGRPFLHFHQAPEGTYADVRFGRGDFEPVWAGTPKERLELLARVADHVEQVARPRRQRRDDAQPRRQRRR